MKVYQIMHHDGYYNNWPEFDGVVFSSREDCHKYFDENKDKLQSFFGDEPKSLEDDETDFCDYFISVLEVLP